MAGVRPGQLISAVIRFAPHLRGSSPRLAGADVLAGLAVAAVAVPQGLAYALVAGLPPEMGLLAAALPAVVCSFFGSHPYLITGPTNPVALLVGVSVVGPALAMGQVEPLADVFGVGLLVGCILMGFAFVGIGRASRFLSDSVIVGFASGAGVWIALRLLPELSTAPPPPTAAAHGLTPRIAPLLASAIQALFSADPRALLLAVLVPALILALRRLDARLPAALIALALAAWISAQLGWSDGANALPTLGALPAVWPHLRPPEFSRAGELAAPALAIALLVTVQSVAAARALRPPVELPTDWDRELFAQGAGNLAAATLGAMPTCGSLSRSAVARAAGARSRLAGVSSGLAVALLLPVLAPGLARLPLAALVGLVSLSGVELVDLRALRRASATRGDAAVLLATLVATLWIDLVQALYVGLVLSLLLLVRRSGQLQMVELVRGREGRFREIPLDERTGSSPAVLLHLEGDLNFSVASALAERLLEIGARRPKVIVLRLKRAQHLDATLLEALRHACQQLVDGGTQVLLCGLTPELAERLRRSELARVLGADALLLTGERLFEGFEHALARIRALLRPLEDDAIFRCEDEGADSTDRLGTVP